MSTPCIGFGNLTDSSTLSGSGWHSSYPLSNLQDRRLSRYAQTTGTTAEIIFDHGSAKGARVFCLFGHDCGQLDTIAVTRGTTSGGTDVVNEAPVTVWPFTPIDEIYDGGHFGIFVILGSESSARYTKLEVSGSATMRFSRPFVGRLFEPTYSAESGKLEDGWQDPNSTLVRGESGADSPWSRPEQRMAPFEYSALTLTAGSQFHEIVRTHGITEELVYVRSLASRSVQQQYGFLATMQRLSALQNPFFGHNSAAVALIERGGAP